MSPNRFLTFQSGDPCLLQFSFTVEDPDVEQVIYVSWSVDDRPPSRPLVEPQRELLPSGRPVRSSLANYEIRLNTPESRITTAGVYSVEAVIGDGPLVLDGEELKPSSPDPTNPRFRDSVSWLITVSGDVTTCR